MKRIKEFLKRSLRGISQAAMRFPMAVAGFVAATGVIYRVIGYGMNPPLIIQKWLFTLIVGAVLGIALQFAVERFPKLASYRILVYGIGIILIAGYFMILLPAPELSFEITGRSFVAVFALICMVLWVPSFGGAADFNRIALVHFKSLFIAGLYGGVLSGGISAIIAAVDTLLFNVPSDVYLYTVATVWVTFAPVYFLSLLPNFNLRLTTPEKDAAAGGVTATTGRNTVLEEGPFIDEVDQAGDYPKFLEILVSYIAIPLVAAYTAVLVTYFIKILITLNWPSGQLGPMVLIYSMAGLLVFVLASLLENRFAKLYRLLFPKILIPVVIMQLVSVAIRLNAYGVTEFRYYVALFGVFSIVSGILLSSAPVSKNGRIALLAAAFALLSILPPIDAFTVSRVSQIQRVETILIDEGMLVDGKVVAKAAASDNTKIEVTNILNYLERNSSLKYIDWLPEDFTAYQDMYAVFEFEPTYPAYMGDERFTYVSLDFQKPLDITNYDRLLTLYFGGYDIENQMPDQTFEIHGQTYRLEAKRLSNLDLRLTLLDTGGHELVGLDLYEAAIKLMLDSGASKEFMSPEEMSITLENGRYRLRVIFQHVNIFEGGDGEMVADYNLYVLVGIDEEY